MSVNTPKPAIEVEAAPIAKQTRALGCPYPPLDPRAAVWLDGFRSGYGRGSADARDIFAKAFT